MDMKKHYRLSRMRDRLLNWWPDIIGLLLLIIGLAGEINGSIPYLPIPGLEKLYRDLSTDLISIGITVLIIDNANQLLATREEKKRLILQMGSPNNGFAIEATRQLDHRGWLYDMTLRGAYLAGANLSGADLHGAKLSEAYLSEADLHGTKLSEADLSEADLHGAKLHGAKLSGANLSGAKLWGAYLHGADLSGADLIEAKLWGADLSGAELTGADLSRADLSKAIVDINQFVKAHSLEGATMPDGELYDPAIQTFAQQHEKQDTPPTPGTDTASPLQGTSPQ